MATKKAATKKATAKKKSTTKKAAAKKKSVSKKAAVKAPIEEQAAASEAEAAAKKKAAAKQTEANVENAPSTDTITTPQEEKVAKLTPFQIKQRAHLLELRDHLVDAMAGVAQDNLRSRAEGSDASAFGMHQADAGSDAYDRDFALNLLSQEQDALYEIEEAIQRVDNGTYGICEMSGKPIPEARLEAIPFARLTVDCQEKLEQELGRNGGRNYGRPARSLFGLMDSTSSASSGESLDND